MSWSDAVMIRKARAMKRKTFLPFAALRPHHSWASQWAGQARAQLALRMLKRIKVKGGRDDRLCVAPAYGRQLDRFLSLPGRPNRRAGAQVDR